MELVPNTRLGAYQILALIGSGGMGEVYQARDTRLDRVVALKVITGGGTADPALRTPTGETSASGPPSAEDTPLDFLVMEYLEGETLADRLARGRARSTPSATPPMTVDEAVAQFDRKADSEP